ncbi:MAG: molecular chaperone TorD family protein [Sulfurospirillaceae bacterium]|nr:molecular chaperone TorD family protein [Sulfurospirillaceae bacterium]MDD2827799.1 molecular chaperone TorD family protein [Sulfurospirillaceae bacterium]
MKKKIEENAIQLSKRLQMSKTLRDIFTSQDSTSLKIAFDALESPIAISEELLESDFNRYFIGPLSPIADPFSSIYLDELDQVMSKSTLKVRALYETMGFSFPQQNQIPDDHIGIELDAYYQLLYIEEVKNIDYLRELRHYFLHEHLNLWIPLFIERALACKEGPSKAMVYILTQLKSFLIRETNTQGVPA